MWASPDSRRKRPAPLLPSLTHLGSGANGSFADSPNPVPTHGHRDQLLAEVIFADVAEIASSAPGTQAGREPMQGFRTAVASKAPPRSGTAPVKRCAEAGPPVRAKPAAKQSLHLRANSPVYGGEKHHL